MPWWVIRQGGSRFSWGSIPSQESQFLCGVCCHHREKKHRGDLIWGGVQTQDYVLNTNLSSIHSTIPHPFSLNHSIVAWFAHLHHLGFQPTLPNLGKCLCWQRWCGASLGGGQSNTLNLTLRLYSVLFTLHVTSYEDYMTPKQTMWMVAELLTLLGALYFWINLPEGFLVAAYFSWGCPKMFSIYSLN